jgi:hypothetical protein
MNGPQIREYLRECETKFENIFGYEKSWGRGLTYEKPMAANRVVDEISYLKTTGCK